MKKSKIWLLVLFMATLVFGEMELTSRGTVRNALGEDTGLSRGQYEQIRSDYFSKILKEKKLKDHKGKPITDSTMIQELFDNKIDITRSKEILKEVKSLTPFYFPGSFSGDGFSEPDPEKVAIVKEFGLNEVVLGEGFEVVAFGEYVSVDYYDDNKLYYFGTLKFKVDEILMGGELFPIKPEYLYIKSPNTGKLNANHKLVAEKDAPVPKEDQGKRIACFTKRYILNNATRIKNRTENIDYRSIIEQQDIIDPFTLGKGRSFSISDGKVNYNKEDLEVAKDKLRRLEKVLDRKNFYQRRFK